MRFLFNSSPARSSSVMSTLTTITTSAASLLPCQSVPTFDKPAPIHNLPKMRWFLALYLRCHRPTWRTTLKRRDEEHLGRPEETCWLLSRSTRCSVEPVLSHFTAMHLVRFILGMSASGLNFQMYLIDGIYSWNRDRSQAAVDSAESPHRTYDIRQQERLGARSEQRESSLPHFRPPPQYRGTVRCRYGYLTILTKRLTKDSKMQCLLRWMFQQLSMTI